MDASYPASNPFHPVDHSHWPETIKTHFQPNGAQNPLGNGTMNPHSATDPAMSIDGQPSNLKVEDEMNSSDPMWHNRMADAYHPARHFSHPQIITNSGPPVSRMVDTNMVSMPHNHTWPTSQSGSSTPIPLYTPVEGFSQMTYSSVPQNYSYSTDATSAIPMSPQSSQGGWASAASSDGIDQRGMMQSPAYRAPSPSLVVRSDGIRKKNARFEIPKDRNLSNIDAMIQQTTDENEKKELKQQKRLLRNRQAALDSRQRKKTHTEKLEQEKKVSEKKMFDMEETLARLKSTLSIEREQWMQERQQTERYIHALQCEKNEAIRTKTMETAELRGQLMLLKECLSEIEARQKPFPPTAEATSFTTTFNNDYHIHDSFEDEFAFINGDDFKMDEADHPQRQLTPRPTAPPSTAEKADDFSWNTFYMCLLVGALLASHGKPNTSDNTTTSAIASSISPTEADAVLKAVLKRSTPDVVTTTVVNDGAHQAVHSSVLTGEPNVMPTSTLEILHDELSKPSRRQELEAAFSLSASSYNHIINPFNTHLDPNPDPDHEMLSAPKPSQLQQAYANMKAQRNDMDRVTGIGAKVRERSALWDQVPPQVVKNFQDLVRSSAALSDNRDGDNPNH